MASSSTRRTAYSAQAMQTWYRPGMDVGDAYGGFLDAVTPRFLLGLQGKCDRDWANTPCRELPGCAWPQSCVDLWDKEMGKAGILKPAAPPVAAAATGADAGAGANGEAVVGTGLDATAALAAKQSMIGGIFSTIGAVVGTVPAIFGFAQAPKTREHELDLAKLGLKTEKQTTKGLSHQADIAAAEAEGMATTVAYLAGALVIAVAIGGTAYVSAQKRKG